MLKKFINNIREEHKKCKEEYNKLTYFEKRMLSSINDLIFSIFLCFVFYIKVILDILSFLELI